MRSQWTKVHGHVSGICSGLEVREGMTELRDLGGGSSMGGRYARLPQHDDEGGECSCFSLKIKTSDDMPWEATVEGSWTIQQLKHHVCSLPSGLGILLVGHCRGWPDVGRFVMHQPVAKPLALHGGTSSRGRAPANSLYVGACEPSGCMLGY